MDAVTGAEIGTFPMAPRGPMAPTMFMSSADGTRGIYFGDRSRWVIHDAVTGEECAWGRDTDEPLNFGFYLSPDHRFLAVSTFEPITGAFSALHAQLAGGQGWLHVYDTATGAEVCIPIAHGLPACFAPDGKTLAVADRQSQRVGLWDWPLGFALAAGAPDRFADHRAVLRPHVVRVPAFSAKTVWRTRKEWPVLRAATGWIWASPQLRRSTRHAADPSVAVDGGARC